MPHEIEVQLRSGEKAGTEWKKSWNYPDQVRSAMMEFANATGGRIFVGVEETKDANGKPRAKIVGISGRTEADVTNFVRDWSGKEFQPAIRASVSSYTLESTRIDVITVEEARIKPVGTLSGEYRTRHSDGGRGLSYPELRDLFLGKENHAIALAQELKHNEAELNLVLEGAAQNPLRVYEPCFEFGVTDSILSNGYLSIHFDFGLMRQLRRGLLTIAQNASRLVTGFTARKPHEFMDRIQHLAPICKEAICQLSNGLPHST